MENYFLQKIPQSVCFKTCSVVQQFTICTEWEFYMIHMFIFIIALVRLKTVGAKRQLSFSYRL